MNRQEIVAAIRRAARELGRAPSRGELKRTTGVSHYRVLTVFRSLREAVRAAGLEPSRKGRPVSTEELIRDWERVRKKLGRSPSRAEYVREGKYSAGTFVGRFGAWGNIKSLTTKDTKEHKGRIARIARSAKESKSERRTAEIAETAEKNGSRGREEAHRIGGWDKAIAFQWGKEGSLGPSLAVTAPLVQDDKWRRGESAPRCFGLRVAIPGPLEGKRRVTEAVAAMIVNTLAPANSNWQLAIGQNHFTAEAAERRRADPLTNAPVNEMGVVFLFALVAWDLGFQVESLWTRGEPDGRGKRQVAPGKWQDVRIEFEYERKNFRLHGHDPKKCDVLVCWKHNWKECPEEIEVIELSKIFGM